MQVAMQRSLVIARHALRELIVGMWVYVPIAQAVGMVFLLHHV